MEKIIIIGAGPAGISAALYAARANMDPLVINNGIGALEKAEKIENYYGMEHPVSGKELFETGLAQAKALGVRILEAQVLGIGGFDTFTVKTTAGDFDTISVILATGSKRKAPAIRGLRNLREEVSATVLCATHFSTGERMLLYLETATSLFMRQKNWHLWPVLLPFTQMGKNRSFPGNLLLR